MRQRARSFHDGSNHACAAPVDLVSLATAVGCAPRLVPGSFIHTEDDGARLFERIQISHCLLAVAPARSHNNYGKITEKENFEEFRSRKLLFTKSFRATDQLIPKLRLSLYPSKSTRVQHCPLLSIVISSLSDGNETR